MSSSTRRSNPSSTVQCIQDSNEQLSKEIRRLKEGEYRKLYQQTRSFIDALQRTANGKDTMYGASITRVSHVQDAYKESQKMDGDRRSHFTNVIEYFCNIVTTLQNLQKQCEIWFGEAIRELTVHPDQRAHCDRIQEELRFWFRYTDKNKDLSDLHRNKTLEEFRGLNTGEVALWGAVVNLVPVLLKTAQIVADEVAKWTAVTLRLGVGIFATRDQEPTSSPSAAAARKSKMNNGKGSGTSPQQRFTSGTQRKTSGTKKTYADRMDEKYKGKIALLERPPYKPSSQKAHNLYPQLPIHLGDPKQHCP